MSSGIFRLRRIRPCFRRVGAGQGVASGKLRTVAPRAAANAGSCYHPTSLRSHRREVRAASFGHALVRSSAAPLREALGTETRAVIDDSLTRRIVGDRNRSDERHTERFEGPHSRGIAGLDRIDELRREVGRKAHLGSVAEDQPVDVAARSQRIS